MKNKFITVAMSGGIDSSVTAWLLKKLKYKILAIFMINWKENCYKNDLIDVKKICNFLNIKLKIVNYNHLYKKIIFKKFLKNYKKGITPNPDIECNKKIKFKLLLNYIIKKIGADKLATGHYARIKKKNNKYKLLNSKDKSKDQTYFLYKLNNFQLSKLILPLGNLYKKEVRLIAKKLNFPNKYKKESMGICFLEKYKFKYFLNKYIKKKFGYILNNKKEIIGIHDGFFFYTIGQKKNVKVIENYNYNLQYIFKKNYKKNIIYVNKDINNLWLLSIGIIIEDLNWINKKNYNNTYCKSKIRHSKNYILCFLRYINKKIIIVKFNKLQWGISIGQSIVFYKKNTCIGGGIIKKTINVKNKII